MFGMENKKPQLFEFDLERDIKKDPKIGKKILEDVNIKLQEIKGTLRTGASKEGFDSLGILLKGYTALQKVLTKAAKK